MGDLFTLNGLMTLGMLTLLQIVLGFDNLLYISLESKRAPKDKQSSVRKLGIGIAVGLRIVLLIVLWKLVESLQEPFLEFETKAIAAQFSGHSLIVLFGGVFIMYTAVKEIFHMMAIEVDQQANVKPKSAGQVIFWIVLMNLVFSFDSILSAMALTKSLAIMSTAIVIGGVLMIWLADHVSDFLRRNRLFEVLGLFILFIVGIMLVSEGGHLAHLSLFGHAVEPKAKSTFYFVLAILVIVDVVQSRYQKKLLAQAAAQASRDTAGHPAEARGNGRQVHLCRSTQ